MCVCTVACSVYRDGGGDLCVLWMCLQRVVMQRKYKKSPELFENASPYHVMKKALEHAVIPPFMFVHGEV